jgi:hypothetical protein
MVVIQVQIRKNLKDVLLDGGSRVNIIIEKLRVQLGLSKSNPTLYNLRMADLLLVVWLPPSLLQVVGRDFNL